MSELVKKFEGFCKEAHKDQKRWDGQPYWTHPFAVRDILKEKFGIDDEISQCVALAHDIQEDNWEYWEHNVLPYVCFQSYKISASLDILNRNLSNSYKDYILRIANPVVLDITIPVKLSDLTHNMSTLKPGKRLEKYRNAYNFLMHTYAAKKRYDRTPDF